ncbi:MAG: hypothetical protein QM765_02005 [Myxococcales bacterium]
MRHLPVLVALLAIALSSCTGRTLQQVVEESTVCVDGDTCVIAGLTPCGCGYSVNAKSAQEVNEAAAHESCDGRAQPICRSCTPECFPSEGLCGCF